MIQICFPFLWHFLRTCGYGSVNKPVFLSSVRVIMEKSANEYLTQTG